MNKSTLIDRVAKKSDLPRTKAEVAVNCMLQSILSALSDGDKVTLVGFGTFSTYTRPSRSGRNPRTGNPIRISAKNVVKFKPGTRLHRAIK